MQPKKTRSPRERRREILLRAFRIALFTLCWLGGFVSPLSAEAFRPTGDLRFETLVATVQTAPDLQATRRDVRIRGAARQQAELWPNPTLDATWGTIPVGPTNPPNVEAPLANIPNYRVGVSYTFPLGKRGPLQAVRQAEYESATLRHCAVGRQLAFELAHVLGDMAKVELRIAALRSLVEAAKEHERSLSVRESQQWASGLEVDRAIIERGRLEHQIKDAQFEIATLQSECAVLVGRPCETFTSNRDARRFLESWSGEAPQADSRSEPLTQRPDLLVLAADERAARQQGNYFRRMSIPDPTVRLGFVHDQFLLAGAQPSSLELTLMLPIPMFDWGQAGVRSALASAEGAAAERQARLQLSESLLPSLKTSWETQRLRRHQLLQLLIPKAQTVLGSVERAYETRLLSIADVIQARRTLLDLLFEEIEGLSDTYAAALTVRMNLAARPGEGCVGSALN